MENLSKYKNSHCNIRKWEFHSTVFESEKNHQNIRIIPAILRNENFIPLYSMVPIHCIVIETPQHHLITINFVKGTEKH